MKSQKLPKLSSLADLTSHNTYITYDHCLRKFYILLLGSSYRYIAVAEDLSELYQLLKEHSHTQPTTDASTLSAFAQSSLQTLTELGKARFNMPWRWRPWSNNYQLALQQWGPSELADSLLFSSASDGGRSQLEHRKKQVNKLTSRLEKVQAAETINERSQEIGIPYKEGASKALSNEAKKRQQAAA